jgi:hypothetical protein
VDLNTITEVRRLTGKGDEDFDWQEGDSWLAGGAGLFSEPQPHLRRLLDLQGFDWEPLMVGGRDSRYPTPVRSLSCMRWKRLRSVTIRIRVR